MSTTIQLVITSQPLSFVSASDKKGGSTVFFRGTNKVDWLSLNISWTLTHTLGFANKCVSGTRRNAQRNGKTHSTF